MKYTSEYIPKLHIHHQVLVDRLNPGFVLINIVSMLKYEASKKNLYYATWRFDYVMNVIFYASIIPRLV